MCVCVCVCVCVCAAHPAAGPRSFAAPSPPPPPPKPPQVSAHTARAIIVLSDQAHDPDAADAAMLRTVLALRSLPEQLEGHIVTEVRDIDNEPLIKLVGGEAVETIVSHDILGRLMLQSARSPGLAKVVQAVLGFDGDEFYMSAWPELVGVPFGELQARFPKAVPIGVRTQSGEVVLKPPFGRLMKRSDELLVLAEDNDTYKPEVPFVLPVEAGAPLPREKPPEPEKILFCGWRRDIRDMIIQLDKVGVVVSFSFCVSFPRRKAAPRDRAETRTDGLTIDCH